MSVTAGELAAARALAAHPDPARRRQWFPMRRLKREARRAAMATVVPPRKEDAPCCTSRRDKLGRLPIGFCSPSCIRRPAVWQALTQGGNTDG